ncbi:MAG: hypothetical protein U0163_04505 [Gemmatimonadaceae bacterium]
MYLDAALDRDPFYLPALVDRAMLAYRGGDYVAAQRSRPPPCPWTPTIPEQTITTVWPAVALAGTRTPRMGLSWRPSRRIRGAAWTELARLSLSDGHVTAAAAFADKALGVEPDNLDALGVALVAARRAGHRELSPP